MNRRLTACLALAVLAGAALVAAPRQAMSFYPLAQVRPGQIGVGRTVFAGETIEEFKVHILGVLRNVLGPRRDLILARLEGGPLATTGVIQGMSGSPVFIDGQLVGAVSYALGSFPREPIAGITPIGEMMQAVDGAGPRTGGLPAPLSSAATSAEVFAHINKLATRALAPLRPSADFGTVGPAALADLVPSLRPIGAAMVFSGFDPEVDGQLRQALTGGTARQAAGRAAARDLPARPLEPGAAVGMSLVRGDLEMGATGTVTWVDQGRVYAFGHPFLNLGPTSMAMTRSHVYGVLPSLDSSLKIASLGAVIGTMSQDRATAVGGTLGAGPRELAMTVTLKSDRAADRRFSFSVLQDQTLTPLFAYVALLNALVGYERQSGVLSIDATGTTAFGVDGADGKVTIDDSFTGETALTAAAASLTAPIAVAATNEFRTIVPSSLDLTLHVSEQQQSATIERAWLDTVKPKPGATHTLQVLLRDYRGGTETISMPVTMPAQTQGPLTLLVSDAATLATLEQRDLRPGRATSWASILTQLNATRRNNRLYVRLIHAGTGAVIGGETLPGLPASVRSILDTDSTVASAPVSRAVVGAWERRIDRVVRGSRELTLTLVSGQ
jgi:hypothetical protein